MLTSRGLGRVLGDLPRWGSMRSGEFWEQPPLAPHQRERIWVVAHAAGGRLERWPDGEPGLAAQLVAPKWIQESPSTRRREFWEWMMGWPEGWADKAAGNGQVPRVRR